MSLAFCGDYPAQTLLWRVDEGAQLGSDGFEWCDVDVNILLCEWIRVIVDFVDRRGSEVGGVGQGPSEVPGQGTEIVAGFLCGVKTLNALDSDGGGGEIANSEMFGHHFCMLCEDLALCMYSNVL